MMYTSRAYGARIDSDLDLGRFLSGNGIARCQLSLVDCDGPVDTENLPFKTPLQTSHGRELCLASDRPPGPEAEGQAWCFEVRGIVTFCWQSGQAEICYRLKREGNLELLTFWFVHVFLPIYLSLEEGFDFLHAGSVEIDGRAVLFVAPSGGGKSTLTEYFLSRGHQLVTDDKLAVYKESGLFYALPAHGRYRPYRKAEDLGFRARDYATGPLPVGAVYLLQSVAAGEEVQVKEVGGFRKFEQMMPNYLFGYSHLREIRLKYLAELIDSVDVYELSVPHDLERLEAVYGVVAGKTSS